MGETETQSVLHHGEKGRTSAPHAPRSFAVVDVVLRFMLFGAAVICVLVMVTSKETKTFPATVLLGSGPVTVNVTRSSKWRYSPAFVYFIVALSLAGLYSIITFLLALSGLMKRKMSTKLLSHLIIMDVLLLGIVSSATGTAGGVAYLGLKGNSHTAWAKICNRYHKFCRHIGVSVAVSLIASVILVLLVLLNIYALSKKIPK